jgi:hypothetical protein
VFLQQTAIQPAEPSVCHTLLLSSGKKCD